VTSVTCRCLVRGVYLPLHVVVSFLAVASVGTLTTSAKSQTNDQTNQCNTQTSQYNATHKRTTEYNDQKNAKRRKTVQRRTNTTQNNKTTTQQSTKRRNDDQLMITTRCHELPLQQISSITTIHFILSRQRLRQSASQPGRQAGSHCGGVSE